jgi:hypothetical protein
MACGRRSPSDESDRPPGAKTGLSPDEPSVANAIAREELAGRRKGSSQPEHSTNALAELPSRPTCGVKTWATQTTAARRAISPARPMATASRPCGGATGDFWMLPARLVAYIGRSASGYAIDDRGERIEGQARFAAHLPNGAFGRGFDVRSALPAVRAYQPRALPRRREGLPCDLAVDRRDGHARRQQPRADGLGTGHPSPVPGHGVRGASYLGVPWDPQAHTAGWNLAYMPFWAGMLTEAQHPHPVVQRAVRQASWDLFFAENPVCAPPAFVSDPGVDLAELLEGRPLLVLLPAAGRRGMRLSANAGGEIRSEDVVRAIRAECQQSWSNIRKAIAALQGCPHAGFGRGLAPGRPPGRQEGVLKDRVHERNPGPGEVSLQRHNRVGEFPVMAVYVDQVSL